LLHRREANVPILQEAGAAGMGRSTVTREESLPRVLSDGKRFKKDFLAKIKRVLGFRKYRRK
jgi:hypothetical protein